MIGEYPKRHFVKRITTSPNIMKEIFVVHWEELISPLLSTLLEKQYRT